MKNKILYPTKAQTAGRITLGIFFIFTGTAHLTTVRKAFLAQEPNWVPIDADKVVILSGVVEIMLGASSLFLSKQRTTVGWLIALFLVAVFPVNIAQLANHNYGFGLNFDLMLWLTLLFQLLLIILVLVSTGAWGEWRNKRNFKHQVQPTLQ